MSCSGVSIYSQWWKTLLILRFHHDLLMLLCVFIYLDVYSDFRPKTLVSRSFETGFTKKHFWAKKEQCWIILSWGSKPLTNAIGKKSISNFVLESYLEWMKQSQTMEFLFVKELVNLLHSWNQRDRISRRYRVAYSYISISLISQSIVKQFWRSFDYSPVRDEINEILIIKFVLSDYNLELENFSYL